MSNVLAIVLGGGKGSRLYPLTKDRAKPAVPFGGKYRMVDIPISNCINSDFKKIYILTQFNSASLNNHLARTYMFDVFSLGFVEILAADQTFENQSWYQGTADAVRQNLPHFRIQEPTHYIIMSGDQLYRMDMRKMMRKHMESGAEITMAATPVNREDASQLGILGIDSSKRVTDWIEKPGPDVNIQHMKLTSRQIPNQKMRKEGREYLGSMGMYIFNAATLERMLDNDMTDFGKGVIPAAINQGLVNAYVFTGYWVDLGTLKTFYQENLNLASQEPNFSFYDEEMPIYTDRQQLPATRMSYCSIAHSLASEGSIITNATITNSIIGIRTHIQAGVNLNGVICMGATYYETEEEKRKKQKESIPALGIGRDTIVKKTIIDVNARIGRECRIGIDPIKREEGDYGSYHVKDGLIIITKNAVIPSRTTI